MHLIWNTVPSLAHLRETSRIKNWSQNFFIRILTSFEKFPTFPNVPLRDTASMEYRQKLCACSACMRTPRGDCEWSEYTRRFEKHPSIAWRNERRKRKLLPLLQTCVRRGSDRNLILMTRMKGLFIDSFAEDWNIWRKNRTRTELICSDFDAMWWTMWVWQCRWSQTSLSEISIKRSWRAGSLKMWTDFSSTLKVDQEWR